MKKLDWAGIETAIRRKTWENWVRIMGTIQPKYLRYLTVTQELHNRDDGSSNRDADQIVDAKEKKKSSEYGGVHCPIIDKSNQSDNRIQQRNTLTRLTKASPRDGTNPRTKPWKTNNSKKTQTGTIAKQTFLFWESFPPSWKSPESRTVCKFAKETKMTTGIYSTTITIKFSTFTRSINQARSFEKEKNKHKKQKQNQKTNKPWN